jgi:phosphoglucosamine mutase
MGGIFDRHGIRGAANRGTLGASSVLSIAMAAGAVVRRGGRRHLAVVGRDTRLSGHMLEPALSAGFTAVGLDVVLLGQIPTAAVGMMTAELGADLGVMITASQNPYAENGLKFFGADGHLLGDEMEAEIEAGMRAGGQEMEVSSAQIGCVSRLEDAVHRYVERVKKTVPGRFRPDGLKVVIDCANGAACETAPGALRQMGAEMVEIACAPDGFNINANCGATAPSAMQRAVVEHRADLGIALDGDGACLAMADVTGALIDSDHVLGTIAASRWQLGLLPGTGVIGTWSSNFGLDAYLKGLGLELLRGPASERGIVTRMREGGHVLAGEPSGHFVLLDHAATADGLAAALHALLAVAAAGRPASESLRPFELVSQRLANVRAKRDVLRSAQVQATIARVLTRLNGRGHLLVRPSENEPVIHVLAGGKDDALVDEAVSTLANSIAEQGRIARPAGE